MPYLNLNRPKDSKLDIIVVGAGLGGLGASISLLLAGHNVRVLESAVEIGEVGAGIQVLPNASRILRSWGLEGALRKCATEPESLNYWGWQGNKITTMNLQQHGIKYGSPFWNFHRANLHRCLLNRVLELGGTVHCNSRVVDVKCDKESSTAVVFLHSGIELVADLVVGADGVNSTCRDIMLQRRDERTPTGDLAYRLLLDTKSMLNDPELAHFITDPQMNCWLGPNAHCLNYVLRSGKLFNVILVVPDDMPREIRTLPGNVKEMQDFCKGWDPRILKLFTLCGKVAKWKLYIRKGLPHWSHPSGTFTLLGDAVHATLPYISSSTGMALEDAAVLGECFSRLPPTACLKTDARTRSQLVRQALSVFEKCRKERTEKIVRMTNELQCLYHIRDGEGQRERDRLMHINPTGEGEACAWGDPVFGDWLLGYNHVKHVNEHWPSGTRQMRAWTI